MCFTQPNDTVWVRATTLSLSPSSPTRYRWLFLVNPNYYGFSAMVRVLIEDLDLGCAYDSPIECYPSSGAYILTFFDLHAVNPYLHVVVS